LSNSNLAVYLEYETEYLSGCQSQQGGWNFYSNLDMQPCDADTTSQVIKVLLKQGKRHIIRKETIDQLEQWLTINFSSDGYIGSWFIPPVDKCTSHQLQQRNFFRNYVSHDIDTSFDVEVMANVYDMLNELDSFKYADVIDAGLSFLIMNQQHDGSWASTWYFGSYYATYMCTKLLFKLRPSDVSIEKTYWYVKDTQNKDGGWGWTPHKSDPLNTALALLCLHAAHHEVDSKVLQNAVNYLERAVYDVNQLKTCYYINYRKQGLSYFRSNCVSYAYIIKALWLWKGKLS
jgi:squalene-hopene/tetraprenyl-beta-curcumene cyclase